MEAAAATYSDPKARSKHPAFRLLALSPAFTDNAKCWFFKHSVSLSAMVILVNTGYSKSL